MSELQSGILLAEDNAVNRKVALLLLERFGYTADAVETGAQAVKAVESKNYKLILMDVMMPEMDGFEATKRIRAMEQKSGGHVPIIALTALAMVGDRERCLQAGMDDYITKPIDPDLLQRKVISWMAGDNSAADAQPQQQGTEGGSAEPIDFQSVQKAYGKEELTTILKLFLNLSTTSLTQIDECINNGQMATLEFLAHELKGSSYAIYARQMSDVCLRLEHAARKRNEEQVRNLHLQLKQHYIELQQYLQTVLQAT